MPSEPLPTPEEAIRALATEVAERIRHGENVAVIRAELIVSGLEPVLADQILARCRRSARSRGRSTVVMIVSSVIIVISAIAGLIGGVWVAGLVPPAPGLAAMISCLVMGLVVILGFATGVGIGLGITAVLASWSVSGPEDDGGPNA